MLTKEKGINLIMRHAFNLFCVIFLLFADSFAAGICTMSDSYVRKAEEILISSEGLADKEFGAHLRPSENSWALSVILAQSKNPSEIFHRLASSDRKYAVAHAIVGAYQSDRELYSQLKAELVGEDIVLWYQSAGIIFPVKIGDIFSMLEDRGLVADLVFDEIPEFFDTVRPVLEDDPMCLPTHRIETFSESFKIPERGSRE